MQTTRQNPTAAPRAQSSFVAHWQRHDRMMEPFELQLIDAARLEPGERVIDVGCGAGTTSLDAARRLGARGAVVGVDLDADAVATATRRAAAQHLGNIRFVHADAAQMALESGWADAVVSRFGTLHFGQPVAAFAHLRGGMRRGGRLCFVCARDAADNHWATVPLAALQRLRGEELTLPTGGPFTLADPDRIHAILTAAGFHDVALRRVDRDLYVGADLDDALEFFFETDGKKVQALLDALGTARVVETLSEALVPYLRHADVWMPGSVWLVSARS